MENQDLTKAMQKSYSNGLTEIGQSIEIKQKLLTPTNSFRSGNTVNKLQRTHPEQLEAFVAGELLKVVNFVDAKKTLDLEGVTFTAECLIEERKDWSVEEYALVFKKIKKGDFGKYYERLKTAEILEAFSKYEETRCDEREKYRKEEFSEAKFEPHEDVKILYKPKKQLKLQDDPAYRDYVEKEINKQIKKDEDK